MASNNTSTRQTDTWTLFYKANKTKTPTLQAAYHTSFADYDEMTLAMTGLRDNSIFWVVTYPHNFLLLPESPESGNIQIIHQGFTLALLGVPPIVAGVSWNRRSSPFKAFDPDEAVSSLEPPTTKTRSNSSKKIPTIEQFLKVKSTNELKRLEGPSTGERQHRRADQLAELLHYSPGDLRPSRGFAIPERRRCSNYHPKLSTFASQLLSDKDPRKAHGLVTSKTRSWRGMVCKRGITQFFCLGYAAIDVNVRPGGFTIFMFQPKSVGNTQSQSTMKQAVKKP